MKKITRTFKWYNICITDAITGKVLKEELSAKKISKEKVAIAFLKETGFTGFLVDIAEREETRVMDFDVFVINSQVV